MRKILGRDAEGRVVDIDVEGEGPIGSHGGDVVASGDHPDLAAHDALGLATDTDLSDHAATTHGTSAHAISGVMHTGSLNHSALGSVTANQHHNQSHALGGGDHSGSLAQASVTNLVSDLAGKAATEHSHDYADPSHTHTLTDSDVPSAIARDTEVTSAIATHAATPHGGTSEAFPVGSVFLSVVSTNPATLLGYGTWSAFGQGRMLLGWNTGDTDEATGGSSTHTHADHTGVINHTHAVTVTDPQHAHVQGVNSATTGGLSGYTPDTSSNTRVNSGYSTSNAPTGITASTANPAGGVSALSHDSVSNLPPYITVRMWKRTA